MIENTLQFVQRAILKVLLQAEGEWRRSEYWQARYASIYSHLYQDWIDVTEELQTRLIESVVSPLCSREFIEHGLLALRSVQTLFPQDQELYSLVPYLQYNRCRRGELQVGDRVPKLSTLHGMSGNTVSLQALCSPNRISVWIASSIT